MTSGERRNRDRPERLAFGAGLIVLGLALTLGELHVLPVDGLRHLWPTFLLIAGLAKLWSPRHRPAGAFMVGLSLVFFAHALGFASMRRTWPLFIVLGGLAMVWRALARDEQPGAEVG